MYVLHSRGSEAMAYMIVISLWALHYTPYTVFLIDYIYPKWLSRSLRFGVSSHLLKPRYDLTVPTLFLGAIQLELIRFMPWRQSILSIISRGFPTYRSYQASVYTELVLDFILFLISLVALLSIWDNTGVHLLGSTASAEDLPVWIWIHLMHIILLMLRAFFLVVWIIIPVRHRELLESDITLADSPSAVPGAVMTADDEIYDHSHLNEREGEDFQKSNPAHGTVRITRVHRGSGKFSGFTSGLNTISENGGISAIDNISSEGEIGPGYDANGDMRWQGLSTEENIESLRVTCK